METTIVYRGYIGIMGGGISNSSPDFVIHLIQASCVRKEYYEEQDHFLIDAHIVPVEKRGCAHGPR